MLLVIAAVMKKTSKLWNETMHYTGRMMNAAYCINTPVCWNLSVKLNLSFYEGPCEGRALWVWTLKYTMSVLGWGAEASGYDQQWTMKGEKLTLGRKMLKWPWHRVTITFLKRIILKKSLTRLQNESKLCLGAQVRGILFALLDSCWAGSPPKCHR